jgi:hypothetical protein
MKVRKWIGRGVLFLLAGVIVTRRFRDAVTSITKGAKTDGVLEEISCQHFGWTNSIRKQGLCIF